MEPETQPQEPPKTDGRGHRKRNKAQVDADRLLVERWHLSGKTVPWIIVELAKMRSYTLSESQVYADINKLRSKWRQEALAERTTAMGEILRSLRRQEEELWEAWEKSKNGISKQTLSRETPAVKKGKDAVAKETKSATTESSHGDSTYMRLILDIQQERARLLGLYAPIKQEVTGANGGPIQVQTPLSEEAQQAILARHFDRMKRATPDAAPVTATADSAPAITS
jgi:hypothetical protein